MEEEPRLYYSKEEEIEYIVNFEIKEDTIHITIKENNEFAPFTYEESFSKDDFIEHHRIFKACDNIDKILSHLDTLFKKGKLSINKLGPEDQRHLYFKIFNISGEEDTEPFILQRKMVDNKNEALIELYQEQKRQLKIIKEIEKLILKGNQDNKDIKMKILNLLSKGN